MTYKELVYNIADKLTKANLIAVVAASLWVLSNSGIASVGPVIAVMILYQFIIPILVFPSTIFSNFMIFFNYKKRYKLEKLFMALSMSWLNAALSLWVTLIFHFAVGVFSKGYVEAGAMWGSAVSMATLFLWVKRDKNNPFIVTVIEVLQLAVIALSFYKIYNPQTGFWAEFLVLFLIMSICSFVAMITEWSKGGKKKSGSIDEVIDAEEAIASLADDESEVREKS